MQRTFELLTEILSYRSSSLDISRILTGFAMCEDQTETSLDLYVTDEHDAKLDDFLDVLRENEEEPTFRLTVLETGPFRSLAGLAQRPAQNLRIGSSLALERDGPDGTAGLPLFAKCPHKVPTYVLTCRHVLDGELNDRVVRRTPTGDDKVIGRVKKLGLLDEDEQNYFDYSLVQLIQPMDLTLPPPLNPCDKPLGRLSGIDLPAKCEEVYRIGEVAVPGKVRCANGRIRVDLDSGRYLFINQVICEPTTAMPFARPGDSGSLIVKRKDDKAVGVAMAVAATDRLVLRGQSIGTGLVAGCLLVNVLDDLGPDYLPPE